MSAADAKADSTRRLVAGLPPTPGDPYWALIRVNVVGTLLTVAPLLGFYVVVLDITPVQGAWLGACVAVAVVEVLIQDLWMIRRHTAPLRDALAHGGPERWHRALVCALNYPLTSVKRTYGPHVWAPMTIFAGLAVGANLALDLGLQLWQLVVCYLVSVAFMPLIHAMVEWRWAAEALAPVREYAEAVLGGAPDPGPAFRRVGLAAKLFVPVVTVGLTPLTLAVVAGAILFDRAPATTLLEAVSWMAGIGVFWVVVSVWLWTNVFMHEIRERTGALERALERVGRGDLTVPPRLSAGDEFGDLARGIRNMMGGLQEREKLQDLFGRHTSPEVVQLLMSQQGLLSGVRHDATILFSDIRNFTKMSERMEPEAVVALLNRYLDVMVRAIHEHRGRIDKFIGDGILAVFGYPLEDPDHVANAVRSTLAMREGLARLNAELQAEGRPALAFGAGVHTGPVVCGSIGSHDRLEFTVIGDTVNTASRVEGLTKKLGCDIVVTGRVQAATAELFVYEHRAPEEVKGKTIALDVFVLAGPKAG